MATLELEGPATGWVASVGYDDLGELRAVEARAGWQRDVEQLIKRLLQEPYAGKAMLGERVFPGDEDLLEDLASVLRKRRPLCLGERLTGYVVGGSRYIETPDSDDADGAP